MASNVPISTLIVDDEDPARGRIRQLLKSEPDFTLAGECSNGRQAADEIRAQNPDLVFLDVQMPRLNGFQVLEAVAAEGVSLPLVVFVTAYDTYALKAFEVHAVDYLLKPFDRERFQKTLARVREQLRGPADRPADAALVALLQDLKAGHSKPDRLVFKEDGRVIFLRADTIDWIEADGNYVGVHAGVESHYYRDTLAALETQLPPNTFMRISRSALVNLDRVKELRPLFYGDYVVILASGAQVNMSRTHRHRVEALLVSRQRS